MGMLGDRIGGKNALALCLLIGAVNTALLLFAREFWALVVFTFIGGITGAAPIALGPMVQVDTLGLRRYGSIARLLGIAFTLGPPLVGDSPTSPAPTPRHSTSARWSHWWAPLLHSFVWRLRRHGLACWSGRNRITAADL